MLISQSLNGREFRLESPPFIYEHHSSVAQLVEQAAVNRLVGGSSPSRGAKYINGLDKFCLTHFYLSELLSELF